MTAQKRTMAPEGPTTRIEPAKVYRAPKDLHVISTYFDSEGYSNKLRHLRAYLRVMEESGIPVLLVEGAFRRRPFLLRESEKVVHVRCPSVMWQKERLLNIALDHLPASCRKVAWLDTDVFFENPDWAVETSRLLDRYSVVQPFDIALWLPKGATAFRGKGMAFPSFAATARRHPGLFLSGDFDRHGHSGYAWAARRELIAKHGLYDRSVVGSGDHLMAHAMMGDLWSPCVSNSVGVSGPFRESFVSWAKPFHQEVRSNIGAASGALLHRWHGDRKKRRYYKRMVGILSRGYDPAKDVRVAPSGALEWTDHGATLGRWMKDYFAGRQEDGKPGPVPAVPPDVVESLRHDPVSELDIALEPIAPILGPLATAISERSEDFEAQGLVPVLPYLVASLVLETRLGSQDPQVAAASKESVQTPGRSSVWNVSPVVGAAGGLGTPSSPSGLDLPDLGPSPDLRSGEHRDRGSLARHTAVQSMVEQVLTSALHARRNDPKRWSQSSPQERWASIVGPQRAATKAQFEELMYRLKDPRLRDAPELRAAKTQLRNRRARLAGRAKGSLAPFDVAVGPGSSATGLDHV